MPSRSCPADLLPGACSVSGSNLPPLRGRARGAGGSAAAWVAGVPAAGEGGELCLSPSLFSCEVVLKREAKENVWIIYLSGLRTAWPAAPRAGRGGDRACSGDLVFWGSGRG